MLEYSLYLFLGIAFVLVAFAASFFLAPHHPSPCKLDSYECGELPVGSSWIQFNSRYYIIGLIFVIFDVEVIFLVPWALVLKTLGVTALIEMIIFLAILILGLIWAWRKGALEWT